MNWPVLPLLCLALIPYFAWGIYAMHRKFLLHHEWPMHVEAASLGGLLLLYGLTFPLLRMYLAESPAAMIFACLGLFVSGLALYGHMAISLTAKLVVDTVTSGPAEISTGPRLGPAEALERQKDFEGAYAEYLILARMYPRDAQVRLRLADTARKLGKHLEAVEIFERVQALPLTRDQHATATVRIAELADRELGDPERARRAVEGYLKAHPDAPDREAFEMRLAGIGKQPEAPSVGLSLVSMQETSLAQEQHYAAEPSPQRSANPMGLERMDGRSDD